MHHDYYFMWCFNPVFYSKFIWKKRRKIILVFWYFLSKITYVWICRQKILKKKNLIIDMLNTRFFECMQVSCADLEGTGEEHSETPFPISPSLRQSRSSLAPPFSGKNIGTAHGYFLVFITQVAWRFMAYTRDLIKRNHPI